MVISVNGERAELVGQSRVNAAVFGGSKHVWNLQSIHHIEKYPVTDNLHPFVPEIPDVELSEMHFVYELGPEIIPPKEIRTGDKIVMSNRVWAQLDTLLTSDTITEAMEISKARNT